MPRSNTQSERDTLHAQAIRACARIVEHDGFRLVMLKAPFRQGPEYGHIAYEDSGTHLSLCGAIAVSRFGTYPLLDLDRVDCPGCLRAFIGIVAP